MYFGFAHASLPSANRSKSGADVGFIVLRSPLESMVLPKDLKVFGNLSGPAGGLKAIHSLLHAHGKGPAETIGFTTCSHVIQAARRRQFFCPASRQQCRAAEKLIFLRIYHVLR